MTDPAGVSRVRAPLPARRACRSSSRASPPRPMSSTARVPLLDPVFARRDARRAQPRTGRWPQTSRAHRRRPRSCCWWSSRRSTAARGRPLLVAVPEDVGRVELAAFVLLPALLPLIFGGQWRSALVTASANLVLLLALIYGVLGYGLPSILRWAVRAARRPARGSRSSLLARGPPLLMIFAVLLFLTQEMWQIFAASPTGISCVILGVLFVGLGSALPRSPGFPREVRGARARGRPRAAAARAPSAP